MGKVVMPKTLTAENGAKALLSGEFAEHDWIDCPLCLKGGIDDYCEECSGEGRVRIDVPVSWTTIKAIYKMAVRHLGEKESTPSLVAALEKIRECCNGHVGSGPLKTINEIARDALKNLDPGSSPG